MVTMWYLERKKTFSSCQWCQWWPWVQEEDRPAGCNLSVSYASAKWLHIPLSTNNQPPRWSWQSLRFTIIWKQPLISSLTLGTRHSMWREGRGQMTGLMMSRWPGPGCWPGKSRQSHCGHQDEDCMWCLPWTHSDVTTQPTLLDIFTPSTHNVHEINPKH